jgi:hypothetical protein
VISPRASFALIICAAVMIIFLGQSIHPIPQPQTYHNFADARKLFGIENFWNVLSNIPFALVGIAGLSFILSPSHVTFKNRQEKWPWIGLCIGFILTSIGSSYYHLAPDNYRLVWDRLPMTIVFMSLASALIGERICVRLGLIIWPILLTIGFGSVIYWYTSEQQGTGDLRFYLAVQLFTLATLIIMLATPSPYTLSGSIAFVALFYILAIVCEVFDHQIFNATGRIVSGHTLKHLFASLAALSIILMLWKRKLKPLSV